MPEFSDDINDVLRDLNGRALRPGDPTVGPGELAALITESAEVLPGTTLGAAGFTFLAWWVDTGWLSGLLAVAAVLLGLRTLWHLVFLVRAGLGLRDRLADEAAQLARLRELGIDPGEVW